MGANIYLNHIASYKIDMKLRVYSGRKAWRSYNLLPVGDESLWCLEVALLNINREKLKLIWTCAVYISLLFNIAVD